MNPNNTVSSSEWAQQFEDHYSTLSSVVGDDEKCKATWENARIYNPDPLAEFHNKFWGTSMTVEGEEWRRNEIGVRHGAHFPGCYALNIDLQGFDFKKIWIRADYIRIYDHLEEYYRSFKTKQGPKPAAVVTGQPGIGKSVWIYYAVRRRLAEEKPVIWYRSNTCFLFVKDGVFQVPLDFRPQFFKTVIWTLVDSDGNPGGVPASLTERDMNRYVIYVSSPSQKRWHTMEKVFRVTVAIMDPWEKEEIGYAAPLLLNPCDLKTVFEIYDELGPIPRICIHRLSTSKTSVEAYRQQVMDSIRTVNAEQVEEMFSNRPHLPVNISTEAMMDLSNKLCLLRRADPNEISGNVTVAPISNFVAGKLSARLQLFESQAQIRLYKAFGFLPSCRSMTGKLFEVYCHHRFRRHICIKFLRMVRLPDPEPDSRDRQSKKRKLSSGGTATRSSPRSQWHSSHKVLKNAVLEKQRQNAQQSPKSLDVYPTSTITYTDTSPLPMNPNVYYIPKKENQVALDSFIVHEDHLYIFQFTGGQQHDIKNGLLAFLQGCDGLPPVANRHFIFVIPDDVEVLKCPFPESEDLQKLPLYSSVVVVEADDPAVDRRELELQSLRAKIALQEEQIRQLQKNCGCVSI